MRFVDADALIETMEGHVTTMSVCSTTIEARAKGQMKQTCIADVANAPTVDVIPVEWLKQQFYNNPNSQWAEKCRDVFTGWQRWQRMQKEQEAR